MSDTAVLENDVTRLKEDTRDLWAAINELRSSVKTIMTKYVPVWVVVVMTAMGSITGASVALAAMAFRMR